MHISLQPSTTTASFFVRYTNWPIVALCRPEETPESRRHAPTLRLQAAGSGQRSSGPRCAPAPPGRARGYFLLPGRVGAEGGPPFPEGPFLPPLEVLFPPSALALPTRVPHTPREGQAVAPGSALAHQLSSSRAASAARRRSSPGWEVLPALRSAGPELRACWWPRVLAAGSRGLVPAPCGCEGGSGGGTGRGRSRGDPCRETRSTPTTLLRFFQPLSPLSLFPLR